MSQYKIPVLGSGIVKKLTGFTASNTLNSLIISQLNNVAALYDNDILITQKANITNIKKTSILSLNNSLVALSQVVNTHYSIFYNAPILDSNLGTFTAGSWKKRELTFAHPNNAFGSLNSSSQITLPAGTYYCNIHCPVSTVGAHKVILQNITTSTRILLGLSLEDTPTYMEESYGMVFGRFTLADEAIIEIWHRCETTVANTGFGSSNNIYSPLFVNQIPSVIAEFWKLDENSYPYKMCFSQYVSGTNGGSTAVGLNTVPLTHSNGNCTDITLSSNEITFQAGTYVCKAHGVFHSVSRCYMHLGTEDTIILQGQIGYGINCCLLSLLSGLFVVEEETTYKLLVYTNAAKVDIGLGKPCSFAGAGEIYATAEFWKIA